MIGEFALASQSEIEKMIQSIVEDKTHGADWLSNSALEVIKKTALDVAVEDSSELKMVLYDVAKKLSASRPSIASLTNKVSKILFEVLNASAPLSELRRFTAVKASELIDASRKNKKMAVMKTIKLLEGIETLITYSYSSTVYDVLSDLEDIKVIVPESRPLFEGRLLAEHLARKGLRVTLIADAAIAFYIGEAQSALVGADSVLADGSIINKVGTKLLALAAADVNIPLHVVSETSKFDVVNYLARPPILEEKNPSEISGAISGVDVKNPYFEVTPAHLVTSIITERGVMRGEEIEYFMKNMSKIVESLFDF